MVPGEPEREGTYRIVVSILWYRAGDAGALGPGCEPLRPERTGWDGLLVRWTRKFDAEQLCLGLQIVEVGHLPRRSYRDRGAVKRPHY